MWFKKKPVELVHAEVNPNTGQISCELTCTRKDEMYLLWFEKPVNSIHLRRLKDALAARGIKALVVHGLDKPQIFDFKEEKESKESTEGEVK